MRIIVTGTTGGIGGAVKAAALSHGHEVVDFNRAEFAAIDCDQRAPFPAAGTFDAVAFCTGTCPVHPVALTSDALLAETVRVNCGLFLSLLLDTAVGASVVIMDLAAFLLATVISKFRK